MLSDLNQHVYLFTLIFTVKWIAQVEWEASYEVAKKIRSTDIQPSLQQYDSRVRDPRHDE
jgi:hypothetical protein